MRDSSRSSVGYWAMAWWLLPILLLCAACGSAFNLGSGNRPNAWRRFAALPPLPVPAAIPDGVPAIAEGMTVKGSDFAADLPHQLAITDVDLEGYVLFQLGQKPPKGAPPAPAAYALYRIQLPPAAGLYPKLRFEWYYHETAEFTPVVAMVNWQRNRWDSWETPQHGGLLLDLLDPYLNSQSMMIIAVAAMGYGQKSLAQIVIAQNAPPELRWHYDLISEARPKGLPGDQAHSIDFSVQPRDVDGECVRAYYDFENDGIVDYEGGFTTSHVYPASGEYEARITVVDNEGAASSETFVVHPICWSKAQVPGVIFIVHLTIHISLYLNGYSLRQYFHRGYKSIKFVKVTRLQSQIVVNLSI